MNRLSFFYPFHFPEEISHLSQSAPRKITQHGNQIRLELLTSESSRKKITPLLLTLKNKSETPLESNERGVEKFVFVLSGNVTLQIDGNDFALKTEETLYFDASLPHKISNASPETARILITVSPSKI